VSDSLLSKNFFP